MMMIIIIIIIMIIVVIIMLINNIITDSLPINIVAFYNSASSYKTFLSRRIIGVRIQWLTGYRNSRMSCA